MMAACAACLTAAVKLPMTYDALVMVQKPLDGGVDYCKRKVQQMADNLQEISKVGPSEAVHISKLWPGAAVQDMS
jgi:hypothetical protein